VINGISFKSGAEEDVNNHVLLQQQQQNRQGVNDGTLLTQPSQQRWAVLGCRPSLLFCCGQEGALKPFEIHWKC